MAKPIYLTFKEDEEEIYEWIVNHSSKGGYIKDLVKADMKKNKKSKTMKGFLTLQDE